MSKVKNRDQKKDTGGRLEGWEKGRKEVKGHKRQIKLETQQE